MRKSILLLTICGIFLCPMMLFSKTTFMSPVIFFSHYYILLVLIIIELPFYYFSLEKKLFIDTIIITLLANAASLIINYLIMFFVFYAAESMYYLTVNAKMYNYDFAGIYFFIFAYLLSVFISTATEYIVFHYYTKIRRIGYNKKIAVRLILVANVITMGIAWVLGIVY